MLPVLDTSVLIKDATVSTIKGLLLYYTEHAGLRYNSTVKSFIYSPAKYVKEDSIDLIHIFKLNELSSDILLPFAYMNSVYVLNRNPCTHTGSFEPSESPKSSLDNIYFNMT